MVYAILGPIMRVLPLFLIASCLVAVGGPPWLALVAAAWFAWRAYGGFRNSAFIYRAIARRQQWRQSYYDSLFYQGASRREAYDTSKWAWLHDPMTFLTASTCVVLLIGLYVVQVRSR
jgi:hypothetical protein